MGNWLKGRVLINDDVTMIDTATNQPMSLPVVHQSSDYQVDSVQPMSNQHMPVYYPYSSPVLLNQLAEEEQIQLAKRIGLIQHLPVGTYDGGGSSKNNRECVICMVEFSKGDAIRFLPCLHTYHMQCIDVWLMRSFICPSCMEPVDVALLNTSY